MFPNVLLRVSARNINSESKAFTSRKSRAFSSASLLASRALMIGIRCSARAILCFSKRVASQSSASHLQVLSKGIAPSSDSSQSIASSYAAILASSVEISVPPSDARGSFTFTKMPVTIPATQRTVAMVRGIQAARGASPSASSSSSSCSFLSTIRATTSPTAVPTTVQTSIARNRYMPDPASATSLTADFSSPLLRSTYSANDLLARPP